MGIVQVGCCALAGAAAFACAFLATGGRRMTTQRHDDALARWMRSLLRLPLVSEVSERMEASRHRAECLRQMPVMLDVVTLGLSAGLSFDSSLELYCHRHHDALAEALSAAMLSWRLGTTDREHALANTARRLQMASLDRFAGVVSQALAFGSPLAADRKSVV